MPNDLSLVRRVVALMREHEVDAWVFGGWAEELHGLGRPRPHSDIDLLYPAPGFERVDAMIAALGLEEVVAKRSERKRAFVYEGVLVELIRAQPDGGPVGVMGDRVPIATRDRVVAYRTAHGEASKRFASPRDG